MMSSGHTSTPALILIVGPPASGKTTLGAAVAAALGAMLERGAPSLDLPSTVIRVDATDLAAVDPQRVIREVRRAAGCG